MSLWLLLMAVSAPALVFCDYHPFVHEEGSLGEVYTYEITSDQPAVLRYPVKSNNSTGTIDADTGFRLTVTSDKVRPDFPLIVSSKSRRTGHYWQLPANKTNNKEGRTVPALLVRTLCGLVSANATSTIQKGILAELQVSTFNLMFTKFSISLEVQSDFHLVAGETRSFNLSSGGKAGAVSATVTFRGEVPDGAEYAVIRLQNGAPVRVHVQATCPTIDDWGRAALFDDSGESGFATTDASFYATQPGNTVGLTLARKKYPKGFYITFALSQEHVPPEVEWTLPTSKAKFSATLDSGLTKEGFSAAVMALVGFVVAVYVVAAAGVIICLIRRKRENIDNDRQSLLGDAGNEEEGSVPEVRVDEAASVTSEANHHGEAAASVADTFDQGETERKRTAVEEFEEEQRLMRGDGGAGYANVQQLKQQLLNAGGDDGPVQNEHPDRGAVVPYGVRQENDGDNDDTIGDDDDHRDVEQQNADDVLDVSVSPASRDDSAPRLREMFPLCVFFALPVVMTTKSRLEELDSHDDDRCYHNFLCAHSALGFPDFSHVISNLAYVAFGLLFILLTLLRSRIEKRQPSNPVVTIPTGLPCQKDIYVLLGLFLLLEGLLSATYHLCPDRSNLQQDLLFIYALEITVLLKAHLSATMTDLGQYWGRHKLWLSLLSAVVLSCLGTTISSTIAFYIASVVYALFCPAVSYALYYYGEMRSVTLTDSLPTIEVPVNWFHPGVWTNTAANLISLIIGNALVALEDDTTLVPSFIFVLIGINAVAATAYTYYRLFAVASNYADVSRRTISLFLSAVGLILWLLAFACFASRNYDTAETPEESRNLNAHCQLMGFYDWHDLWHVVSATAAFVSLGALVAADEALKNVPRAVLNRAFCS